jgi:hypothetical protein
VCLSLFSNGIVSLFVFTSFTAEVDIVWLLILILYHT